MPLKRYSPFGVRREPKPDRSDEFASWAPRPRAVAPSTGLPVVTLLERVEADDELVDDVALPPTAEASAHMGRIKRMRCICCQLLNRQQQSITDVHHIRQGRIARNDWLTIPLCHEDCHQGSHGVHGDRAHLRQLGLGEFDLLAVVLAIYVKEHVQ